ncbi:methyltransferase domain-containing protein [Caldichromatium japonicum]|uniref:Methyltransferase domain-containing protein n=1 Tax=Caldichromatium japonicum TaxID=2699430 RepID=A0A6G7VGK1_9GAMM|nr:class I SAM-dependent methyltransferase [Caldichromatium japonicum]QIK39006.1 methyltransferase domain-containing protein [Caldichromatium japonicum]
MPRVDTKLFYGCAFEVHGETPRGVQWNSVDNQEVRFRVLREFLSPDLSGLTLVDAGCGFGDLYLYLTRQGEVVGRYIGIDVMAPMVEAARRRTGCEILLCDILDESSELPPADVYLCSGAMNTFTRKETRCFIERCLDASRLGFVFNLLKGWNTSTIYNLYLPREIRALARELGVDCEIREGYLATDFSAAFWKNGREG